MTTYYEMKSEMDSWISVQFRVPYQFFIKKLNGNIKQFHRKLSNGQTRLMGKSNRTFWKQIKRGFYRYYFTKDYIHFVYHLQGLNQVERRFTQEIIIRIRKIMDVPVEVLPFEMMNPDEVVLLNLPFGLSNYYKIKPLKGSCSLRQAGT
jgi:hypothetical protein